MRDDDDWVESTVLSRAFPIAQKKHMCKSCGNYILPGQQYARVVWIVDDDFYVEKHHFGYCK